MHTLDGRRGRDRGVEHFPPGGGVLEIRVGFDQGSLAHGLLYYKKKN
jgi:hypothetical protein